MKRTHLKKIKPGFTLVELLVVIAILAVLAAVGFTVFTNVQKNARDGRRKEDINAITKAFEVSYAGSSYTISSNSFAGGVTPVPPEGGNYGIYQPADHSTFRVCAVLDGGPNSTCSSPAPLCYCGSSAQALYAGTGGSVGGSNGGPGLDHPSTCDTTGTLGTGLVGYWKLNEGLGTTTYDSSGYSNNGSLINSPSWLNGVSCMGGSCLQFLNNQTSYVAIPITSSSLLNLGSSDFTVTGWITASQPVSQNGTGLFGKYPHTTSYNGNFVIGFYDLSGNNNLFFMHRNAIGSIYSLSNYSYSSYFGSRTLIVYVKSGNYFYLYINPQDGQPKQTTNISSIPININFYGNGSNYYISNTGWAPGVWPNIIIDEHRIYNRALSQTEIQALYNSGNGCLPS